MAAYMVCLHPGIAACRECVLQHSLCLPTNIAGSAKETLPRRFGFPALQSVEPEHMEDSSGGRSLRWR